jgi:hypothetical protein
VAHLADTVETRALRGRKRRAKTERQDARWLRELLAEGRLPEAWIAWLRKHFPCHEIPGALKTFPAWLAASASSRLAPRAGAAWT